MVSPRSFSGDELLAMVTQLKRFAGKVVSVETYALDTEALVVATQLLSVFNAAGMPTVDNRSTESVTGGFEVGISVRGSDREVVDGIVAALSAAGKETQVANSPPVRTGARIRSGHSVPNGATEVKIGIKPIPPVTIVK